MNRARSTRVVRTLSELWLRASRSGVFRRTALPLAAYYAVTLALPLANGAAQSDAFVEHALVVLVVPPVAIILAFAVYRVAHALGRACLSFALPRRAKRRRRAGQRFAAPPDFRSAAR